MNDLDANHLHRRRTHVVQFAPIIETNAHTQYHVACCGKGRAVMEPEKKWPRVGDQLIHRFRKKSGHVLAEVISVDKKNGSITLRIGSETFPSLSSAAQAVAGTAMNGWTYWGLKKQRPSKPVAAAARRRS